MYGSVSQTFIAVAKWEKQPGGRKVSLGLSIQTPRSFLEAEHSSGQLTSQQPESAGRVDPLAGFLLPLLYSFMAPTHENGQPILREGFFLLNQSSEKMTLQALKGVIFWSTRQLLIPSVWQSHGFTEYMLHSNCCRTENSWAEPSKYVKDGQVCGVVLWKGSRPAFCPTQLLHG